MKAVVREPNVVDVIDVEPPQVGPYQALVRTRLASLRNGTDGKLVSEHEDVMVWVGFPPRDATVARRTMSGRRRHGCPNRSATDRCSGSCHEFASETRDGEDGLPMQDLLVADGEAEAPN